MIIAVDRDDYSEPDIAVSIHSAFATCCRVLSLLLLRLLLRCDIRGSALFCVEGLTLAV